MKVGSPNILYIPKVEASATTRNAFYVDVPAPSEPIMLKKFTLNEYVDGSVRVRIAATGIPATGSGLGYLQAFRNGIPFGSVLQVNPGSGDEEMCLEYTVFWPAGTTIELWGYSEETVTGGFLAELCIQYDLATTRRMTESSV
jgi:hypothetical protein